MLTNVETKTKFIFLLTYNIMNYSINQLNEQLKI